MAESGLTVACISDRDKSIYPNNVGSHYTVKLPKALNFSSATLNESTSKWEVAMMDCHYLHNFYNFREACTLHIIIEKPADSESDMTEEPSPRCTYLERRRRKYLSSSLHIELVRTYFQNLQMLYYNELAKIPVALLGVVRIPASYYPSVPAVLDQLTCEFDKLFYPRYKLRLHATIGENGMVVFSTSSGKVPAMYAETPYIASVLGLGTKPMVLSVEDAPSDMDGASLLSPIASQFSESEVTLHELAVSGTNKPKLDRVQGLYIYGDIIERQYVGNSMSPLLDYMEVPNSLGERVCHTCDPLIYLPVSRSIIDTTSIRICDERGRDVAFPDDVSNVVIRLHFRVSAV